jgi:carboxyl-terminal processing protease
MKNYKLFIVISSAVCVGFFSAMSLSQIQIKTLKIENKNTNETTDQRILFEDIVKKVRSEYVEEKSDKDLYEMAADGLLSSLDPHSSYLNEDSYKEMQVQTKGEFGGLGVEITMEHQLIKVVTAIEDTPAYRVGVKPGDYIAKINGKTVIGLSIDEVVKKLRGKPGTDVKITILRKGEGEPIEKNVTRQIIKVKAVKSKKIGDIAYVKINSFSEQAYSGMEKEINRLKKEIGEESFKGLVLDLRNNPGGLLDQAVKISDAFLNKDATIVSIRGRDKDKVTIFKDESNESLVYGSPIVVIINEGSASASEIVAGALQDNKRAIIVGSKSFGKGSVQTVIPLTKNNAAIRLTTSLYYTPSGKSIQASGIQPDIEIDNNKILEKLENKDRNSEADLKGHIEVQIQEEIKKTKDAKNESSDDDLYEKDYQLARSVDLIKGLKLFNYKK